MNGGVGLRTPRGSGTNGYVQKNASFVKPKPKTNYKRDEEAPAPIRKPNDEVLMHKQKRAIEVDLLELRTKLEKKYAEQQNEMKTKLIAASYTENEDGQLAEIEVVAKDPNDLTLNRIEEIISTERAKRLKVLAQKAHESKEELLKERKEIEMANLAGAFGIRPGAAPGSSFKFLESKQKKPETYKANREIEYEERERRLL